MKSLCGRLPLLAQVISELVHHYRSPNAGVDQALDALESKGWLISPLTANLDMSFHLMDFGPPPFPRECSRR
ncbi:hypothetical protein KCP71_22360 [Salmonella enterica subsp. enterica]|nr:hypothetical protein KCP71_22360 [Salmonella enterica subsp. enterica]